MAIESSGLKAPEGSAEPFRYAPWGKRCGALLIDFLIFIAALTAVGLLQRLLTGTLDEEGQGPELIVGLAAVPFIPLYFAIAHSRGRGQTLGKRATGIAVRHAGTGGRLSFGRAVARGYFMFGFWWFTAYIGALVDVLWPLWDSRNQTLHDKVVNSVVVRVP